MMPSRGMGVVNPKKLPKASKPLPKTTKKRDGNLAVGLFSKGGKVSKVNEAGNYTKPGLRKNLFEKVKASGVQGTAPGQWSARKAQLLAKKYKAAGGGYK